MVLWFLVPPIHEYFFKLLTIFTPSFEDNFDVVWYNINKFFLIIDFLLKISIHDFITLNAAVSNSSSTFSVFSFKNSGHFSQVFYLVRIGSGGNTVDGSLSLYTWTHNGAFTKTFLIFDIKLFTMGYSYLTTPAAHGLNRYNVPNLTKIFLNVQLLLPCKKRHHWPSKLFYLLALQIYK